MTTSSHVPYGSSLRQSSSLSEVCKETSTTSNYVGNVGCSQTFSRAPTQTNLFLANERNCPHDSHMETPKTELDALQYNT
eukprot:5762103-Amphidinium_carterae.2